MKWLSRLATCVGITVAYHDAAGVLRVASPETQRALLASLGFPAHTESQARDALRALIADRGIVPRTLVSRGGKIRLPLRLPPGSTRLTWTVDLEGGGCVTGTVNVTAMRRTSSGSRCLAVQLELPDVALGYHTLRIRSGGSEATSTLIVAPSAAHKPAWQEDDARIWGLTLQVYALRAESDWGMGDLSALERIAHLVKVSGGDLVAINPLHALFSDRPREANPYWASSRLFLNPLYLDFEALPRGITTPALDALTSSPGFRERIRAARDLDLIDYEKVAALKNAALDALLPLPAQQEAALAAYVKAAGDSLKSFAVFCALSDAYRGVPWARWPAAYRRPDTPEVRAWAIAHADHIKRHLVAQWLASEGLARTAAACAGMKLGLMRDLAIGFSPDGADAWTHQSQLARGVHLGAPPDDFAPKGQDWGIPPFDPRRMRDQGYGALATALRSNMTHAGALRIDHVMGLQQQFWIPDGGTPSDGTYVRFPFDDCLGIVALESVRNSCLMVGEDLGTVAAGFRERMAVENIFSTRLFRFERYPDGIFKRPDTYPKGALASVGTHDLPTLAAFWTGADLDDQTVPREGDSGAAQRGRARDRVLILAALRDQGLIPAEDGDILLEVLIRAVHAFLARTPTAVVALMPEDILALTGQINVPGTSFEHPNWRRRLPVSVDALGRVTAWRATVEVMRAHRPPQSTAGRSA